MDHNGANGQPNVTDTYFDIVVMKNMFSSPVEHDVTGFLSAKHQSKNYYTMVKQVKKKKLLHEQCIVYFFCIFTAVFSNNCMEFILAAKLYLLFVC